MNKQRLLATLSGIAMYLASTSSLVRVILKCHISSFPQIALSEQRVLDEDLDDDDELTTHYYYMM
ncbi:hypothetical protein L484_024068 [Morus notabilis]|uniref:Uncharacterized protein n=1 Tax=Morus notabilis TaxID=981085 RepID=W9SEB2_9ROSA|nr:hypothetical protein L484_024068 [Morus notabilis]